MTHKQESKHDWVYEVFLDLSNYAQKNKMPQLLRQIEGSLEALEPELGTAGRLPELRIFFAQHSKKNYGNQVLESSRQ